MRFFVNESSSELTLSNICIMTTMLPNATKMLIFFAMEDFELFNRVSTFDESLWMNSETSLENPPKLFKMNGRYTKLKPSCSTDLGSFSV